MGWLEKEQEYKLFIFIKYFQPGYTLVLEVDPETSPLKLPLDFHRSAQLLYTDPNIKHLQDTRVPHLTALPSITGAGAQISLACPLP